MAGIRKKGNASYRTFRFQGRRYSFTIGNLSEARVQAKGIEVNAGQLLALFRHRSWPTYWKR